MDELLKQLEDKSYTKTQLLQILSNIITVNFSSNDPSNNTVKIAECIKSYKKSDKVYCNTCDRDFNTVKSLNKHLSRNKICVENVANIDKNILKKINKNIKSFITDIIHEAVRGSSEVECKYCNATFVNKSVLYNHGDKSPICNYLAFQYIKDKLNSM